MRIPRSLNEIYTPWLVVIIIFVFAQFIFSNIILKKTIYDPIGKYFGSILFGGIGLTILFSDQQIYNLVTVVIFLIAVLSLISRFYYLLKRKYQK